MMHPRTIECKQRAGTRPFFGRGGGTRASESSGKLRKSDFILPLSCRLVSDLMISNRRCKAWNQGKEKKEDGAEANAVWMRIRG